MSCGGLLRNTTGAVSLDRAWQLWGEIEKLLTVRIDARLYRYTLGCLFDLDPQADA